MGAAAAKLFVVGMAFEGDHGQPLPADPHRVDCILLVPGTSPPSMHRFALKCEQPGGVYFAYGSLVNPATWPTDFDADPAVLHGWLRSWSHCIETESGKVCALAIVRRRHKAVRGVLLTGRLSVEEMDRREIGYLRREVRVTCQRGQRLTGKIVRASVYIGSPNHLRRGVGSSPSGAAISTVSWPDITN